MLQTSGVAAAIVEQRKRGTKLVLVVVGVGKATARGVAVMVVCGNWPAPLCQSER